MPFGPFLTKEQKKEINDAAYRNNRQVPSMMTSGQTYGNASYSQQQKTDAINAGVRSALGLDRKPTTVIGPGGGNGFGLGSNNTKNTPGNPGNSGGYYGPGGNSDGSGQGQAQQSPGIGPFQGHGTIDIPRPSQPTGEPAMSPDTSRTNANGVIQTGKQMTVSAAFVPEYANSSFNDLLAAQGNQRYSGFNSSQLPETQGNPFSGTAPKTQSFNAQAPGISGATYDNYGADGGVAAASSTDRSQFTPISGKDERIEGGSDRKKGGSLDEALADKAGINSYMSKFSSGNRERAARSAFLNAEDSLSGLQARDAVNDVIYAGGQHYGRDGDGTFKLDRADARQVASGQAKAQDFLKAKIDTTVDAQKQTPAEAQDPLSVAGSAVKSGFAAGAQTDFSLNNNQPAPQAGVGPVVPTDQIPKDLSGAAGKKYLADLDAGRLFK